MNAAKARESRVLGGTSQFSMGSLLVRKRKGPQEIPSLQQLCVYSVIDNIDKLQCVGDVPNDLLSPILRKCNAQQLWRIESASKRDLNTEHLWKRHCESLGVNGKEEKESWKQTWSKEMKRQAEKQKNLGSKLRKMYNEASEGSNRFVFVFLFLFFFVFFESLFASYSYFSSS
ncbi:Elongin-A [Balamuthia mandrillaris]